MQVELIKMYDLINAVPPNTKGTICNIDDTGTLYVEWKNRSITRLIVGTDEFKILDNLEEKEND